MHAKRLFVAAALVAPALTARADDNTLLIELERRSAALPGSVSASGSVVVGSFDEGGGFYWMPTTGVVSIGGASGGDVSQDGRTIVGTAADSRRIRPAAIWLRAAEWRLLGSFGPNAAPCDNSLSTASGTSRDGKVVVGMAQNGCTFAHAFRWEESTGLVDLGSSVAGRASFARGVSADGRVIVGYQDRADGFTGRALDRRPAGIVSRTDRSVRHCVGRKRRRLDHRGQSVRPGRSTGSQRSERVDVDGARRPAMSACTAPAAVSPARQSSSMPTPRAQTAGEFCDPFGFCGSVLHQIEVAAAGVVRF